MVQCFAAKIKKPEEKTKFSSGSKQNMSN